MNLLNCILFVLSIFALKSVSGLRLAEPYAEQFLSNTTEIQKAVPVIGFLKTHKTASSTLLKILQTFAHTHGMQIGFPPDDHYWGWPSSFPGKGNKQEPSPNYDLIANHAVFNSAKWKQYLASNPVFASVVREPSSQAVSAYDYFGDNHTLNFSQHLEWLAALQSPAQTSIDISPNTARFLNPQAWDFGWYEYVGLTTKYDNNMTMIRRWLTELDNDFTNVIILESLDEGLALFARTLNIEPRDFAYVTMNEGNNKKTVPSKEEYSKLSKLYSVDRALYKHFKDAFQSHWANVPESERTHDLAQLKKATGTLQAQCGHQEACPVAWTMGEVAYTRYLHLKSGNRMAESEQELYEKSEQFAASQYAEQYFADLTEYSEQLSHFHSMR